MNGVIRTSLDVGFPSGEADAFRLAWRGRNWREIGAVTAFPFDDSQFQVVLLHESVLSRESVREAHRVLARDGRLVFHVPLKTGKREGYTLQMVYSLVRDGFDIVDIRRTAWWRFWVRNRRLVIIARKKAWKSLKNSYRPYVV